MANISLSLHCPKCNCDKPSSEFYYDKRRNRYRLDCKACFAAKRTRDKRRAERRKAAEARGKKYRTLDEVKVPKPSCPIREARRAWMYWLSVAPDWWMQSYCNAKLKRERQRALNTYYRKLGRERDPSRLYETLRGERKPGAALRRRLRTRIDRQIRNALKGKERQRGLFNLLGYSCDELKQHLERTFTKGMGWNNVGDWHIDHILPVSSFDLTDAEQLARCWSLPNLRALWARDNMTKGARRTHLL